MEYGDYAMMGSHYDYNSHSRNAYAMPYNAMYGSSPPPGLSNNSLPNARNSGRGAPNLMYNQRRNSGGGMPPNAIPNPRKSDRGMPNSMPNPRTSLSGTPGPATYVKSPQTRKKNPPTHVKNPSTSVSGMPDSYVKSSPSTHVQNPPTSKTSENPPERIEAKAEITEAEEITKAEETAEDEVNGAHCPSVKAEEETWVPGRFSSIVSDNMGTKDDGQGFTSKIISLIPDGVKDAFNSAKEMWGKTFDKFPLCVQLPDDVDEENDAPIVVNIHDVIPEKMSNSKKIKAWTALDPERHIYIGRPSVWGNPFRVDQNSSRADVAAKYHTYLTREHPELLEHLPEVKGKVLGCWCHPNPCHGHVVRGLYLDYSRKMCKCRTCENF